jgi:hypothetical protein
MYDIDDLVLHYVIFHTDSENMYSTHTWCYTYRDPISGEYSTSGYYTNEAAARESARNQLNIWINTSKIQQTQRIRTAFSYLYESFLYKNCANDSFGPVYWRIPTICEKFRTSFAKLRCQFETLNISFDHRDEIAALFQKFCFEMGLNSKEFNNYRSEFFDFGSDYIWPA